MIHLASEPGEGRLVDAPLPIMASPAYGATQTWANFFLDTLEQQATETGPNAGDGKLNPYKSPFVGGVTRTDQERADLIALLEALTDEAFLNDPSLADAFL